MYSINIAHALTPEQLWGWHAARRSINEALAQLDGARAALLPLVADTEWHSDGVRALHEIIETFLETCSSATVQLQTSLIELEAAA